jgi:hypothetical protein
MSDRRRFGGLHGVPHCVLLIEADEDICFTIVDDCFANVLAFAFSWAAAWLNTFFFASLPPVVSSTLLIISVLTDSGFATLFDMLYEPPCDQTRNNAMR